MILSGGKSVKKLWILILIAFLLCGCGAKETFETVDDANAVPATAIQYKLFVDLPEGTAQQTVTQDTDVLYICDNYLMTVQTMEGGDLARTVKRVTGLEKDALTLISTKQNGFKSWHCAWTTTGDEGQQVCRAVILDDGAQHHAVTVMADQAAAGELAEQWQQVLGTATLISTG